MTNPNRPCHCFLDADGDLIEHLFVTGRPECQACGWTACVGGCNTLVPDLNTRCEFCHPLACPCQECRDCECAGCVAAGLVEDDSDGVPQPVGDDDTSAVRTVRVENVATGQLVAEWIDRLYSQEAA